MIKALSISLVFTAFSVLSIAQKIDSSLFLKKTITGKISPKSIVHSGEGLFFAQNMMYRHTVTVYDRKYQLVKVIKDGINPKDFGLDKYNFKLKGGPVECTFTHGGKYAWVSNYSMIGGGEKYFNNPGCDNCSSKTKYDSSFVYRINTTTLQIEEIIKVGAVPKYLCPTPDEKFVLVSNWSSGSVSIIDTEKNQVIKDVYVGSYPRGIVVDSKSRTAYIAVMGRKKIAVLDLLNYQVSFIQDVGKGPRHLCIDASDEFLYCTLNSTSQLAKINLKNYEVSKVKTGKQPRTMYLSKDGFLYLVNYNDNSFSKIDSKDLSTKAISATKKKPIGITYDEKTKEVWVACYSGYLQIFKDSLVKSSVSHNISAEIEKEVLSANSEEVEVTETIVKDTVLKLDSSSITPETLVRAKRWSPFFYTAKRIKPDVIIAAQEIIATQSNEEPKKEEPIFIENTIHKQDPYWLVVGAYSKDKGVKITLNQLDQSGIKGFSYFRKEKNITYVVGATAASESGAEQKTQLLKELGYASWVYEP